MKNKRYFFLLIVISCLLQTCENASEINEIDSLTQGLIAYYPFNGNADDASGNGHHGVVIGATLVSDRFDQTQNAYLFDGVNDYIDLGSDNLLKPV